MCTTAWIGPASKQASRARESAMSPTTSETSPPAGSASRCPSLRSSSTTGRRPDRARALTTWLPTYPAPPVTRTRIEPSAARSSRFPLSCAGMRLYHASSPFQTKGPVSVENVTEVVRREVTASGVAEGIVIVSVPHTTCGMAVNEDEPGLRNDIRRLVERLLAPMAREAPFDHNCVDDNAQAHLTSL